MNTTHKNTNKGFTLLEILLVIAAIGILAVIVLVAINPTRQINQVRQAAINSDKNTIEKALQQRLIDTGSYPAGLDEVQRPICSNGNTPPNCVDLSGLIPDYVAAIPSSTTYTVARGNDGRVYVNTAETAANLNCPIGYIRVPGNSLYQTKDFCVMKYEAKAVSISNPTLGLTTPNTGSNTIANNTTATTAANGRAIASVASGYPIANIDQPTAASYCTNAGASLMTNAEGMTIARNIESVSDNWYNPTPTPVSQVGNGGIWRGHSDNNPTNALAASTNDNLGYEGTGNSINNGWQQKRTHTLSNGEIIWDISGNLWEWTTDTIQQKDMPYSNNQISWAGVEFNNIINNGILNYDYYRPSNIAWNSSNNIGQLISHAPNSSTQIYGWMRGGSWQGGWDATQEGAGVFSIGPCGTTCSLPTHGFRCVIK
jgi:prepilin-type N-terminal cleavage/methylation domain-containing protein